MNPGHGRLSPYEDDPASCPAIVHFGHRLTRPDLPGGGSGRVVQTIDRQKQAGGTERAVIRDASGRIIGTATTRVSTGGNAHTTYRDANGRSAGSATTQGSSSGASRTTYRDANGRTSGSATTRNFSGSGSRTQFRDASGRLTGTESSQSNCTMTTTRRDASGRYTGGARAAAHARPGRACRLCQRERSGNLAGENTLHLSVIPCRLFPDSPTSLFPP